MAASQVVARGRPYRMKEMVTEGLEVEVDGGLASGVTITQGRIV